MTECGGLGALSRGAVPVRIRESERDTPEPVETGDDTIGFVDTAQDKVESEDNTAAIKICWSESSFWGMGRSYMRRYAAVSLWRGGTKNVKRSPVVGNTSRRCNDPFAGSRPKRHENLQAQPGSHNFSVATFDDEIAMRNVIDNRTRGSKGHGNSLDCFLSTEKTIMKRQVTAGGGKPQNWRDP